MRNFVTTGRTLALAFTALVALQLGSASTCAPQFPIMAWGDVPWTSPALDEMKSSGINVAGFCRIEDLPRVADAGLKCFVKDPRASSYTWAALPPDDVILKRLAGLKTDMANSPAAIGIFLSDEPAPESLEGIARIASLVRRVMPEMRIYLNLLPFFGKDVDSLAAYIQRLNDGISAIKAPFLSYDHYAYINGALNDSFYTNLEIFRATSITTGLPFWNCILSNTHYLYSEPSDASLHLQVYGSLAYGAQGIEYFTYLTPSVSNYRLGPIDQTGNKTSTWYMLRRINAELNVVGPLISSLTSSAVYHFPTAPMLGRELPADLTLHGVHIGGELLGAQFLVGDLTGHDGSRYLLVVNKSLQNSLHLSLSADGKHQLVRVNPFTARDETMNAESNWIAPGSGNLYRVMADSAH